MTQYIDKSALVAEIERRLEALANTSAGNDRELAAIIGAQHYELISLVQYINTLEVKEVDLDADFGVYWGEYCNCDGNINDYEVAKHFYELGLKAQKGE